MGKVTSLPSRTSLHYEELTVVYLTLDQVVFRLAGYPAPKLAWTHGRGWYLEGYGFMEAPDLAFLHQDQMFRWVALQVALFHSGGRHSRYVSRLTVHILAKYGIEAQPAKVGKSFIPSALIPGGLMACYMKVAREYKWLVPLTRDTRAVMEERARARRERLDALPSCPVVSLADKVADDE